MQTEKFDACVIPWDADTSDFLNMVTTLGIQTPCITLCIRRENCPMQECHNSSLSSLVPYPVRLWDIMEATVKALVPEMVDDSEVDDIYQVPPVNFDLQLRNFDGDWPFVLELYQMFLLEGTEKMSRFVAAVQTWDIKEVRIPLARLQRDGESAKQHTGPVYQPICFCGERRRRGRGKVSQ